MRSGVMNQALTSLGFLQRKLNKKRPGFPGRFGFYEIMTSNPYRTGIKKHIRIDGVDREHAESLCAALIIHTDLTLTQALLLSNLCKHVHADTLCLHVREFYICLHSSWSIRLCMIANDWGCSGGIVFSTQGVLMASLIKSVSDPSCVYPSPTRGCPYSAYVSMPPPTIQPSVISAENVTVTWVASLGISTRGPNGCT